MTRIWERLYVGNLKDAAQLAAENPFGITAVLSLSLLSQSAKKGKPDQLHSYPHS